MKKKILCMLSLMGSLTYLPPDFRAQTSQRGLPLSMRNDLQANAVPITSYTAPDWDSYLSEASRLNNSSLLPKDNKMGLHIDIDFRFPNSGSFEYLPDGTRIWRGTIVVHEAPAVGLLFDRFRLPAGVRLYVTNGSQNQVAGAFTDKNNSLSGKFAIDAIQGDTISVELNIEPAADAGEISLHSHRALIFFRAVEHLKKYAVRGTVPIDIYDAYFNGNASVCMINAICPQGTDYDISRQATVQLIDLSTGIACSGTLINNTSNTSDNCRPYILTATHCEETGSFSSTDFDEFIIRFNFERPDCEGLEATNGVSILGANVIARADYDPSFEVDDIIGDFMLLELRESIPEDLGVVLSGWDRRNDISTSLTLPEKFISFHHPHADNKKLSTGPAIMSVNHNSEIHDPEGSRWFINFEEGYVYGGSSGSGLFEGRGRLIGIASIADMTDDIADSCNFNTYGDLSLALSTVWYDKLWHAWDFSHDGPADNRKLKPWLDPWNSDVLTLEPLTASCEAIGTTSIKSNNINLDEYINLYPNPSNTGYIDISYNLIQKNDMEIVIIDISGKSVYNTRIKDAYNGSKRLDLSGLPNGLYMIKITSFNAFTTKKLIISR